MSWAGRWPAATGAASGPKHCLDSCHVCFHLVSRSSFKTYYVCCYIMNKERDLKRLSCPRSHEPLEWNQSSMCFALGICLPLFPGEKQARKEGSGRPEGERWWGGELSFSRDVSLKGLVRLLSWEQHGRPRPSKQVVTMCQLYGIPASTTFLSSKRNLSFPCWV